MNDTIEIPIEPGRHTLQVRSGRNSSRTRTFDAADLQTVAFRCTGRVFCRSSLRPSSSPAWRSNSGAPSMKGLRNVVLARWPGVRRNLGFTTDQSRVGMSVNEPSLSHSR